MLCSTICLNDSHVKKFSTKAPQYYADGAVYPIGKPTLNEEGYWGESYNFEVSAAYVKTFAEKLRLMLNSFIMLQKILDGILMHIVGNTYLRLWTSYLPVQQIRSRMAGNSDEGGRMDW